MSFGRRLPGTSTNEINVTAPGAMRFVDSGKRYSPGEWPTTEPDVFNAAAAPTALGSTPPLDRAPTYSPPNPSGG